MLQRRVHLWSGLLWRTSPSWDGSRRWLSDSQRVAANESPQQPTRSQPAAPAQPREGHTGSFLAKHGRDLTHEASEGLLDPVLGREDVVQRCLQILLRRTKNNPVLIGDPGVGKTAVAEGIAQLLAGGGVAAASGVRLALPPGLGGRRLVALDVGSLVAGTQYRGTLEERLQGVLREVRTSRGQVILFIDELHMLVDAGRVEGGLDAANLLKPALARGELRCIGATTVEEYRKHVEADAAFARRFQAVMVEEPSPDEALACLQGLLPKYESHHGVRFEAGALEAAVGAAQRYIPDRRLPDSAIDIMDQAAARARLEAAAAAAAAAAAPPGPTAPLAPAGEPDPATSAAARAGAGAGKGSLAYGGGGWQRPPSGLGRSPDEERELLEWFGSTLAERQRGAAGRSGGSGSGGRSSSVAGVSEAGAGPGSHPQQQPGGLQQQQQQQQQQPAQPVPPDTSMLPCPHCGTPTPSKKGAITVVCSKCHACFLNLPPQQLMLGASLFLRKQQASHAAGAKAAAAAKQAAGQEAAAAAGGAGTLPAEEDSRPVVAAADVLAVVAEGAGVPLSHISRSDWESLLALETSLLQQVAGQDAAVRALASSVRLGRLGLQQGRRPLASFVLTGTRGTGRATLCKALATSLFASDRSLLRFDMSECADRTALSRLVGAPPGYVGYGDGGTLTEAVRRRPHSVVVFEHAERAHPEVLNLLTQAVEGGQITDSMGRKIDFRNAVVIFTTTAVAPAPTPATGFAGPSAANANANSSSGGSSGSGGGGGNDSSSSGGNSSSGSSTSVPVLEQDHVQRHRQDPSHHHHVGSYPGNHFASPSQTSHSAAALSLSLEDRGSSGSSSGSGSASGSAAQSAPMAGSAVGVPARQVPRLPAELLAAVDAVVPLGPLSSDAMRQVAAMQLQACRQLLGEQGVELEVGEGVEEWLGGQGFSKDEGALPLQRLLRQQLLGPAAQALLEQRMELAQQAQQQGSVLGMKAGTVACRVLVTLGSGGVGLEVRQEGLL